MIHTCQHCGETYTNPLSTSRFCSQKCREAQAEYTGTLKKWHRPGADIPTKHRCCDCGKATPDHRCRACREKWLRKHGLCLETVSNMADAY